MEKLKQLNTKLLGLIDAYSNKILGALAVACLIGAALSFKVWRGNITTPISVRGFATTSVKITNIDKNTGGSGVIYRSSSSGSEILTNAHVCRLVTHGGVVQYNGRDLLVQGYKIYQNHDLCLVLVRDNLGVSTGVASESPELYDRAFISGHPALLPHVLTEGNFSGNNIIDVLIGFRQCTERERVTRPLECIVLGGMPIVQKFESQLVTGTILPGSSGSAVFNNKGEIAGVVFAGRSREMSYAFIVPYAYVQDFLLTEFMTEYTMIDYKGATEESETEESMICKIPNAETNEFCQNLIEHLIWVK